MGNETIGTTAYGSSRISKFILILYNITLNYINYTKLSVKLLVSSLSIYFAPIVSKLTIFLKLKLFKIILHPNAAIKQKYRIWDEIVSGASLWVEKTMSGIWIERTKKSTQWREEK